MLTRTAFKRKTFQAEPRPEKVTKWPVALDVRARAAIHTIAPEFKSQPKTVQHRNARLLALAKGKPCLLLVPACCNHRTDTTVACHSNAGAHGKAKARKADDPYTVWGCAACHSWLDSGPAPRAQKEAVFMAAHLRQVNAWRLLAVDTGIPASEKKAAQWALDLLDATPVFSIENAP